MGPTRRRPIGQPAAWVVVAVAILLASCSGGRPEVSELLLSPEDFPGLEVTQTRLEMVQTADGEPAAQVELSGPQFTLSHNLVMFETPEAALSILAGIKEGQIAQGIILEKMDNFRDVSGILSEVRGSQEMLTLFFVEGRALVRISLSGPERHVLLPIYAEKARAKASRQ